MKCPKCKRDTLALDTTPGTPPRTYACPCGFVFHHYKAPAADKQTPNNRYDVKARIHRMLKAGFTDAHIEACIDVKKKTMQKYMCEVKKELGIPVRQRRIK